MSAFTALCKKEWHSLIRDPHGLAVLFVVPAAFILLMSLALRDAFSIDLQSALRIEVQNQDGGALSERFAQQVLSSPSFVASDDDPQLRVSLLPGFSELLATRFEFAEDYLDGEVEPTILHLRYEPVLPPQARLAARLQLAHHLLSLQNDELVTSTLGYDEQAASALRYLNQPDHLPISESLMGHADEAPVPSASQHSTPAWLIFALFFSAIPIAGSLVTERLEGSLLRLRLLDVPGTLLLGAKAAAFHVIHLLQVALMLMVGVWVAPLMGADALQVPMAPLRLWMLAASTSVAALGLALVVAVLVRSHTQSTIAGGATTLLLAALGGILVPVSVMPPVMQSIASLSPMNWALQGFQQFLLSNAGVDQLVLPCVWLLAFGSAGLAFAAGIFRLGESR